MSTQPYTTNPGTINQHVTSPSRRPRWILAVAAAVTVAIAALALVLWHAPSSTAPATTGPSTSTSVPAGTRRSRPGRPSTPRSRPLPRHRAARAEAPATTR